MSSEARGYPVTDWEVGDDEAPVVTKGAVELEATAPVQPDTMEDRRTYIGGSDAFRVVTDRYALWEEKAGMAPPVDLSDIELVQWGKILEAVVAQEYMRRTGNRVRRYSRLIRHPRFPWMGAHMDRILEGKDGGLEVKTAGAGKIEEWGEEGSEDVPPRYFWQVQHYMAVTGRSYFDIPVLFGGQRMPIYTVRRDEKFIADLVEIEREFWRLVEERTPPEPETSEEASRRWPISREGEVQADSYLVETVQQLREQKERIKEAEAKAESLELLIKTALADKGDTLMAGAVKLATWKNQTTRRVNMDEVKRQAEEDPVFASIIETCKQDYVSRVLRLSKQK